MSHFLCCGSLTFNDQAIGRLRFRLFGRLGLGNFIASEALILNAIAKFSGNKGRSIEFLDRDTKTEDAALSVSSDNGLGISAGIKTLSDKRHGGCALDSFPIPRVERIAIICNIEDDDFGSAPVSLIEDLKPLIGGLIQLSQFDRKARITDESARVRCELNKLADDFCRANASTEEHDGYGRRRSQ